MSKEIVAVITGVTGGIGKATALALLKEGIQVCGLSNDSVRSLEVERELRMYSPEAQVHVVDFTEESSIATCTNILSELGEIGWLIHVAGYIDKDESFLNTKTLYTTFEVNLFSLMKLYMLVSPNLIEDGGVISISSTASIEGNGMTPAYATSKGALNTFTLSVAQSFRETPKRSIVLCPGPTNTLMRENLRGDAAKHQDPEVIAHVIEKIVRKRSPYRNGDIVIVKDGNDTLHSSITI